MLKIALIDEDKDYANAFSRIFERECDVQAMTFVTEDACENKKEFKYFDMIYVDNGLSWESGPKVIDRLSLFTDADFALIGVGDHFKKKNVDNPNISALIMKENERYVLEWYNDTKKKRELLK